ncbi:hypothetical protein L2E82_43255 [Cichorium intybus]|uniref:Uncharacterized protein n=1 Tax=Cichorium intybus TaxID=13427 RepID=A0ACB8ZMX7_CICIN|nr:hypothetical protein L2E82_43255 [Cichorium intybus]
MHLEMPGIGQELSLSRFHHTKRCGDTVDCAVCLSTIEEDDEISVLRCEHLLHKGCLDRCVDGQHTACPQCRDVLVGPRMVCELGRELLSFGLCSQSR